MRKRIGAKTEDLSVSPFDPSRYLRTGPSRRPFETPQDRPSWPPQGERQPGLRGLSSDQISTKPRLTRSAWSTFRIVSGVTRPSRLESRCLSTDRI